MTQHELNRAVARATGENLRVIRKLGFTLADAVFVEHDPEPCEVEVVDIQEKGIDWDEHQLRRNVPVVAQRARRPTFV